jgi:hypothetical protein
MARANKSNVLKFKAKNRVVKSQKPEEATRAETAPKRKPDGEAIGTAPLADAPKLTAKAEGEAKSQGDRKVSQRLLETIERRKKGQAEGGKGLFAKPPGRRGRRPKAVSEYVPGNNEEETFVMENDYEGIEYDTGIRVKEGGEEKGYNLDRFEDYDEELNFDW